MIKSKQIKFYQFSNKYIVYQNLIAKVISKGVVTSSLYK